MLRQTMGNKLSTRFDPTVFTVVSRAGSELIIENVETGTRYRRNVAHVTKVELGPNQTFAFSAQPPLAITQIAFPQTATSQQSSSSFKLCRGTLIAPTPGLSHFPDETNTSSSHIVSGTHVSGRKRK
jgi:hypothetical protein